MNAPRRIEPKPGQESVWDYPRPPRMEPTNRRLRVELAGQVLADTIRGLRVLETAGAPVYYFPPEDVRTDLLEPVSHRTFCEWKGHAEYFDAVTGDRRVARVGWRYPQPLPGYEAIAGRYAFYAGRVDAAWVDDERVTPQPGGFYGGWITGDVAGPLQG